MQRITLLEIHLNWHWWTIFQIEWPITPGTCPLALSSTQLNSTQLNTKPFVQLWTWKSPAPSYKVLTSAIAEHVFTDYLTERFNIIITDKKVFDIIKENIWSSPFEYVQNIAIISKDPLPIDIIIQQ